MASASHTQVYADSDAQTSGAQSRVAAAAMRRREMQFIWSFWIFIALLTFANAWLNDAMSGGKKLLPLTAPLVTAIVNSVAWAAITPAIFRLTSRYSLDRPRWLPSLVLLLGLGVLIAMGVAQLMSTIRYQQALHYLRTGIADGTVNIDSVAQQFWFMKEYVIYLVVLCGAYAHDYFVRYRVQHEQANLLAAEAAHVRAELADARLATLRAQLNPHFLFNTLNAVSSLVERDPRGARRMISHLSELLRDTLDETGNEVELARELQTMHRYIAIMQTRFGDRLQTVVEVSPEALTAQVPALLLQPLVENAFKHGIEKLIGPCRLEVRASRAGAALLVSVTNTGIAQKLTTGSASPQQGGGIGLQNTRDRLQQCYGGEQSLSLRSLPTGGAVVEISLPFHSCSPKLAQSA
jgi:two-component sensor histidine kinase